MRKNTAELVDIIDALPEEKKSEVIDFIKFIMQDWGQSLTFDKSVKCQGLTPEATFCLQFFLLYIHRKKFL